MRALNVVVKATGQLNATEDAQHTRATNVVGSVTGPKIVTTYTLAVKIGLVKRLSMITTILNQQH